MCILGGSGPGRAVGHPRLDFVGTEHLSWGLGLGIRFAESEG